MKKIKFKVWDKGRNKFAKQIATFNFDRNGSINLVVYLEKSNKKNQIYENEKIYTNEFEILEYTGLKDKNGVEVYEGDICEYHNGRGVYIGVVKYITERTVFKLVFGDGSWTDLAFVEVIGNIFENPELLEVEDD